MSLYMEVVDEENFCSVRKRKGNEIVVRIAITLVVVCSKEYVKTVQRIFLVM